LAISLYALIINRLFREHWTYSLSCRKAEAEDREAKLCGFWVINIFRRKNGGRGTDKICDILAYHKLPVLVIFSIYMTFWRSCAMAR
jgi:hypothetical protein